MVGVTADDLKCLVESLETIEDTLCGFGDFTAGEVQVKTQDGGLITATYQDNEWRVMCELVKQELS